MALLSLTPEEISQLTDIARGHPDSKLRTRAHILLTMNEKNYSREAVGIMASGFGISRSTLYSWIHRFLAERSTPVNERLTDKASGRPRTRTQAGEEYAKIFEEFKKEFGERFNGEPMPLRIILSNYMNEIENWSKFFTEYAEKFGEYPPVLNQILREYIELKKNSFDAEANAQSLQRQERPIDVQAIERPVGRPQELIALKEWTREIDRQREINRNSVDMTFHRAVELVMQSPRDVGYHDDYWTFESLMNHLRYAEMRKTPRAKIKRVLTRLIKSNKLGKHYLREFQESPRDRGEK